MFLLLSLTPDQALYTIIGVLSGLESREGMRTMKEYIIKMDADNHIKIPDEILKEYNLQKDDVVVFIGINDFIYCRKSISP